MPWFKVDDTLAFHHKVVAAGNAAMGMWVRAGSVCSQQLTDGFIPDHMIASLGGHVLARRLVSAGLWDRADGGYTFHQWEERQPSKEQVETERAAARERQRRAREAARAKRTGHAVTSGEVTPKSHQESRSPRPDPTRPVVPDGTTTPSGDADKPRRPTRRTRLPDDFRPSEDHVRLADELGVNLRAEWPKFCDHWRGNGETKADWPATLRNWIRKAAEYGGRGHGAPARPRRLPEAHEIEQPPDGLSDAEYAAWEREQRERRRA